MRPLNALAAVLLATPRLRRHRDWIRVGVPPVERADEALRAAAECLAERTGRAVALRCGGFQCDSGAAVLRWLRKHAAAVVHEALPPAVAASLLPYDPAGRVRAGRWCAAVVRGRLVHFSRVPKVLAPGAVRVACGRRAPDLVAMAAALSGRRRGALARACRELVRAGDDGPPSPRRICLPVYTPIAEFIAPLP